MTDTPDNVIPLQKRKTPTPQQDPTTPLTCACGSQWFHTSVVLEGTTVTGYAFPLLCASCGKEAPL